MGLKSYPVTLGDGTKVGLRLTLGGQKAMMALNPQHSVIENILDALDDPVIMGELLSQCLNWDGNDNAVHDGDTLYNLLVDSGRSGTQDFGEIILNVCRGAGVLKQEDCERVKRIIHKAAWQQSQNLEAAADDTPQQNAVQNPQEGSQDPLNSIPTLDG